MSDQRDGKTDMKQIAYVLGRNEPAFLLVVIMLLVGAFVAASTGHTTLAWVDGVVAVTTFAVTAFCRWRVIPSGQSAEVG